MSLQYQYRTNFAAQSMAQLHRQQDLRFHRERTDSNNRWNQTMNECAQKSRDRYNKWIDHNRENSINRINNQINCDMSSDEFCCCWIALSIILYDIVAYLPKKIWSYASPYF